MPGLSNNPTTLAVIYHDPKGALFELLADVLPVLSDTFESLAVRASHVAYAQSLVLFREAGADVVQETAEQAAKGSLLGTARREALKLALQGGGNFILYCDCDRMLHWAKHYPDELVQVAAQISAHDFTVLGRTERAFETHPRVQRDTEAIVNYVFSIVSGWTWDVTAGARGLSRRAAQMILDGCPDEDLSVDVAWPLVLKQQGTLTLGYIATEGLEFETADRYHEAIQDAGSYEVWFAQRDMDLKRWGHRLDFARREVEGMLPYMT